MRSGQGPVARIALVGGSAALVALVLSSSAGVEARAQYRVERFDLAHDLTWDELPWTNEDPLGFPARGPRDAQGVPMERCQDGRLVYPTGMLAINGMKRLDAYVDGGDERQLEQALAQARRLRKMARSGGDAWWLPHACDYAPEAQTAPWWNAMTQGLAVSFFVRLYDVTGDDRQLDAARRVARTFARLDRDLGPWVSFVGTDRFLWLEHYPRPAPSHVLNAHLHAIFGLYELWEVTDDRAVRRLVEGAITTMRAQLDRYRRPGALSRYDLKNGTAHVKYHVIHVWQLRYLARISDDAWFWLMADRFARDSRPRRKAPGRPAIALRPPFTDCQVGLSPSEPLLDSGVPVPRTPPSAPVAPTGCG